MGTGTMQMYRGRLLVVGLLMLALGVAVVLRLGEWQIRRHDEMRAYAVESQARKVEVPPRRGVIRDRTGRILAISLHSDRVIGDRDFLDQQSKATRERLLRDAAQILGMSVSDIEQKLRAGTPHFAVIKEDVPIAVSKALNDANLSLAFRVEPSLKRYYPSGALLAHTLGFVNREGQGVGLEGSYNRQLAGVPGLKLWEGESYGHGLSQIPLLVPPQHGSDITLTIDINIQYMAERELEKALVAERTMTGCVVIADPRTGGILAAAGRPTFDPNNYSAVSNTVHVNPIVADAWEPGSIFKILTIAAAIDAGKVRPDETFPDRGKLLWGRGIPITNRENKSYGNITPAQILQYSSNVGVVQVAHALSTTLFYSYTHGMFGIGEITGIDLPYESPGMIRLWNDYFWSSIDLATHSYGQGLTTTPIQMVAAVGALANGGIMMRPYLVSGIQDSTDAPLGPSPVRRVVKPETAAIMTDMLVSVIDKGVPQAKVPGYKLGGKTGTALIPSPDGYKDNPTITSFIGYGPAEDPSFIILVRIDKPQVHELAADAAAPVFKNIAQWLLAYMRIPPSTTTAQR